MHSPHLSLSYPFIPSPNPRASKGLASVAIATCSAMTGSSEAMVPGPLDRTYTSGRPSDVLFPLRMAGGFSPRQQTKETERPGARTSSATEIAFIWNRRRPTKRVLLEGLGPWAEHMSAPAWSQQKDRAQL